MLYLQSAVVLTNVVLLVILAGNKRSAGLVAACTVIQMFLLAIFFLQCISVGFMTTLSQSDLVAELFIVAFSIADAVVAGRTYSYYSCLTLLRLVLILNELIRNKSFRNALEFLKSSWSLLNYFLVLIVVFSYSVGLHIDHSSDWILEDERPGLRKPAQRPLCGTPFSILQQIHLNGLYFDIRQ